MFAAGDLVVAQSSLKAVREQDFVYVTSIQREHLDAVTPYLVQSRVRGGSDEGVAGSSFNDGKPEALP